MGSAALKKILKQTVMTAAVMTVPASMAVNAEQVTFSGKLKTELPRVTINSSPNPVSDVKNFTLSVSPSGGICSIDTVEANAKSHGSTPICLLTWDDPVGLDAHLRGLRGVISGPGEHTFTYKISMFDRDKFDVISEETYSVTFAAPIPSSQPSVLSTWLIKPNSEDLLHNIYNRNEQNKTAQFQLEARNYDQKIEFGEHSCLIPEGQTTCTINLNATFESSETEGERSLGFRATDTFGFFDKEKQTFQYVWDFRPPQIEAVHVNSSEAGLPQVITEYGETLVLMRDQAAVIVKSPHINIADDWWLPTDPTLKIKPNLTLNITNALSINNTTVLFEIGDTSPNAFVASPIASPVRIGEYLVYVYDFSEINDGLYSFEFSTEDRNGNGELRTLDDIYIDRMPPDIQFVINNRQHRTRTPAHIYSLSDITIASWGGWEDGSKIISAKINEEPVSFSGGTDTVKRLSDADLPLGSLNTLEVVAIDKTGNEVLKQLDFHFGNYEFRTYSNTAMSSVQPSELYLETLQGATCIAATSVELAQLYSQTARGLRRGCTIEWVTKPAGLNEDSIATISSKKMLVASGIIDAPGTHEYAFNVYQHDAFGISRLVYEAQGVLDVSPLEAPELTLGLTHIALNFPSTYKYKLPQGRSLNIPTLVNHSKGADLVVELRDHEGNVVETRESSNFRTTTRLTLTRDINYAPLSHHHYVVRAYYKINPELYTEKPYHFYITPPSMVRLALTHPEVAVQGSDIPIMAQIGIPTSGGFQYAPSLGEWDVYLAKYDAELADYVPLTEAVVSDLTGKVSLTLPADVLLASNNRVFAFAKHKTEFPEIDITLRATSLVKVPVLTTGSISVELTSANTSAPAPANFLVRLNYETGSDRLSAESVSWQQSDDGSTWTSIERTQNQQSTFISLPTAQERFVRAAIRHKISDSLEYTNVIKLTAYDEAVLTLYGDTRVLTGAVGRYRFDVNNYAINNASGDVEWSLDNGATWNPMSPTDEAVIPHSLDIMARLLIQPPEGESYYVTDTFTVNQIDPQALKAFVTVSDRKAEIGDEISISAKFSAVDQRNQEHHRYHFLTPEGEEVETLALERTLTANDFANGSALFIFRSWVDGHKMQTISSREISIEQIIYSFPETDIIVPAAERVVQSNINIVLKKPLPYQLPKRVEINEELILPPELELYRHQSRNLTLIANTPGLHSFTVRFYDNRGNQREHIAFVEALEPEDMTMKLISRLEGKHLRPPIRLISRISVKPGSPRDRLDNTNWTLNGEVIDSNLMTSQRAIIEEPGDYTLRVHAESLFGQEAHEEFSFTVFPNKPPYCEPFWEHRDRTLTFNPNCMDDDGRILRIDVTYDIDEFEELTTTRYTVHQITFIKDRYPTSNPLRVSVMDDSGAEINFTFPWPN
ncbi:hypothetical protein [Rheinheimera sp.]|uniref:hypothetical protein n=1 Tax=Rheinheimera sp. TaxID=1869214 RepID=UPI00404858B4